MCCWWWRVAVAMLGSMCPGFLRNPISPQYGCVGCVMLCYGWWLVCDARTQDTGKYRTLPRSPPGHHHRQHQHPTSPATDCILSPSPGNSGSQSVSQRENCISLWYGSSQVEWLIKSTHYMPAQSHDLDCVLLIVYLSKGYKPLFSPSLP